MSPQSVSKTVGATLLKIVRPPVELIITTGAGLLARVERQFSGNGEPAKTSAPAQPSPVEPTSAERPEVVGEETDGLDHAVDRAQEVLGERDARAAS